MAPLQAPRVRRVFISYLFPDNWAAERQPVNTWADVHFAFLVIAADDFIC